LTIKTANNKQVSLGGVGNRRFRKTGIAIVQIFAPLGKGDKPADLLASYIETAFTGSKTDGVHYGVAEVKEIGERNGMWQINVNCPFYADSIS